MENTRAANEVVQDKRIKDMGKMTGICYFVQWSPRIDITRIYGVKCCSGATGNDRQNGKAPQFLKFAVSGVTELLRLFSSNDRDRLDPLNYKQVDKVSVSDVNDVVTILKCDYDNAYFVTGIFTSDIYAEDCIFEDPTISFQGKDLYSRNLKLLVPFFELPSIELQKIEKGFNSNIKLILATWKLRTYLKLPWKPLISIDGSTVYELNDQFKIIRHAENWNVSALEAIGQIFTPSN